MKKLMILIIVVGGLAIASCNDNMYKTVRRYEKRPSADSTSTSLYRLHEIIVIYKKTPSLATVDVIKKKIAAKDIDLGPLTVKKCNDCDDYVELWHAENIHKVVSDSSGGGTVSPRGTNGAAEDGLAYYSLNFLNSIPMDSTLGINSSGLQVVDFSSENKDTIKVAVLDTGIDTRVVSPNLQWKNPHETKNEEDDDGNCYPDDTDGWNFVDNNSDVADDNMNLHGTLVSHYIINEFARSPKNFVQIMSLKTHDSTGYGQLFSSICAIHYAMNKGANIINASWGFYHYTKGSPHPYLDKLITKTMRDKGILFVTAAGNKDEEVDRLATTAYEGVYGPPIPETKLRNLEYHSFYPACLSRRGKNVVTVTTTDGTLVSSNQNYSEIYVDIGVKRDDVDETNAMKFHTPFLGPTFLIGGSSFATAIACGKIGAYFPKSMYLPGLAKDEIFEQVIGATPGSMTPLITFETILSEQLIRDGKMTYPK
jgi:hypothetical protein